MVVTGEHNVSSRPLCPGCRLAVEIGQRDWTGLNGRVWHWDCFAKGHAPRDTDTRMSIYWEMPPPAGDTGLNR